MLKITNAQGIVFAIVLATAVILFMIKVAKSIYKFYHMPYTDPENYPNVQYIEATVVSKWNYMIKGGTAKEPSHQVVYMAEFETQLGQAVKCEVPQEVYMQLQKNQQGTLATVENKFFGFEQ